MILLHSFSKVKEKDVNIFSETTRNKDNKKDLV